MVNYAWSRGKAASAQTLRKYVSINKLGAPRRRLAGAERGSRFLQCVLNIFCKRVRAAEHASRGPFHVLERRHGLAQIVERGAVDPAERLRVNQPESGRFGRRGADILAKRPTAWGKTRLSQLVEQ